MFIRPTERMERPPAAENFNPYALPEFLDGLQLTIPSFKQEESPMCGRYFVDRAEFERMIEANELLEYAEYVNNYYGTSLKVIQDKLENGVDVLLDIEVQGAAKVRAKCPDAVLIFIIPPSFEELSRRLYGRNTDNPDVIEGRLQKAREEYKEIPKYDYLVVNDKVADAAAEIVSILSAEGCRTKRRIHLTEGVTPVS